MCLEDGRPSIVEYYELSDEMMEAKDEKAKGEEEVEITIPAGKMKFRIEDITRK